MTKLHLIRSRGGKGEWKSAVLALAARELGVDPGGLAIETDGYGKPFLPGCPGFHFSVSHTAGLVVIAVSGRPVGVDAEKLRPARLSIADRFFAAAEREYVYGEVEGREERLLTVWTRKEAYLKYTGTGIRVPLAGFDVTDGSLPVRIDSFLAGGYVVSCCGEEPPS